MSTYVPKRICGPHLGLLGALASAVGRAVPSVVGEAINSGTDFGCSPARAFVNAEHTFSSLGCAGALRRVLVQLVAVLSWREIEPAPAGAKKAALVGKAEQVRRLGKRKLQAAQILLG